jgi:hypothetical protein
VHQTFRNYEPITFIEFYRTTLQIDEKPPLHYVKELVLIVVFMPVILALDYAQPHNRIVHTTKCLVPPTVGASCDQCRHINEFQRTIEDV